MTADTFRYPSPFIFVGRETFEKPSGDYVVPVYRSSDATLTLVTPRIAAILSRPSIAPGDLGDDEKRALSEAELICADPQEFRRRHYAQISSAMSASSRRTFVLLPASYCNMGCEYCGQQHTKGGLSGMHRSIVLERILTAIRSEQTESVSVRWFGGEPLMAFAVIRQMSRELVAEAEATRTGYDSNIVTNGALLDDRKLRTLVQDCRISALHITIDGPAEIHDAHRPLKSGGRSFERLVSFLSAAVAAPDYQSTKFVLRTNVDVRNGDYISDYLQTMADRGFAHRPNVLFSLIAVHPWSNDVSALELSKREYAAKEAGWLDEMIRLGLNVQLLPTAVKPAACGAITQAAEVVSSSGGVFSCTEQPLVPHHEQHSVLIPLTELGTARLRPRGEFDDWDRRVAGNTVPCGKCWMLPVCGGHCPKAWAEGDIPCPSMKLNMPERLSLYCRRRGLRPAGRPIA